MNTFIYTVDCSQKITYFILTLPAPTKQCRIFHFFFSSSPRMNTCFNKLAAGLALLDTLYIIFRLLDTLRSKLQLKGIFLVFHAFVTYPIMNVLLFSLVLIPITLAYERYQSIK